MKPQEILRRLRRIRREARTLLAAGPAPALAQTMHTVERACCLAAWQIGETAALLPEGPAAQARGRPARPVRRRAARGRRARAPVHGRRSAGPTGLRRQGHGR